MPLLAYVGGLLLGGRLPLGPWPIALAVGCLGMRWPRLLVGLLLPLGMVRSPPLPRFPEGEAVVRGEVVEPARRVRWGWRAYLRERRWGKVLLYGRGPRPRVGEVLEARVRLVPPRSFRNPGCFDWPAFLAHRGVRAVGFASRVRRVGRRHRRLEAMREAVRRRLGRELPGAERSLLEALLLGERGNIPPRLWERFQRAGVAHLLAVSGLHFGLLALGAFVAVRGLVRRVPSLLLWVELERAAALACLPLMVWYLALCGARLPALRAFIMVVAYLLGLLLRRRSDPENCLWLAGLVILLLWPRALWELSLQLSVLAVLCILRLTPRSGPWPVRCVVASLAALAGLLPLTLRAFHLLSPWGAIATLLLAPLVGWVILPLGMAGAMGLPLALRLSLLPLRLLRRGVEALGALPVLRLPGPSLPQAGLWWLTLWLGHRRSRWCLLTGTLAAAWYLWPPAHPPALYALDAGPGLCAVVDGPRGTLLLLAGGRPGIVSRAVIPFLLQRRLRPRAVVALGEVPPSELRCLREALGGEPARLPLRWGELEVRRASATWALVRWGETEVLVGRGKLPRGLRPRAVVALGTPRGRLPPLTIVAGRARGPWPGTFYTRHGAVVLDLRTGRARRL